MRRSPSATPGRAPLRPTRNSGGRTPGTGSPSPTAGSAEAPIALCGVQGYVYDAYLARAELARELGDDDLAETWADARRALKEAFNERFWLPERGWYAMALDRDKQSGRRLRVEHGALPVERHRRRRQGAARGRAAAVAGDVHRLGRADAGSAMGAYDPVSYHNGSVWPHDNALIVAGLMRYGFVEEAQRIARALLAAAEHFGGRLPELFCGFDRERVPGAGALPDVVLPAGVGRRRSRPARPCAAAIRPPGARRRAVARRPCCPRASRHCASRGSPRETRGSASQCRRTGHVSGRRPGVACEVLAPRPKPPV